MSAKVRSPKIPLSPSSPPETGLKRRRLSDHIPRPPLSPPLMSVATKSYVSSYGNPQHSDQMASRSSPRSPTSASSYTQQSTQRGSQAYSTPASGASTIPGLNMLEDTDQHRDKRQRVETGKEDGDQTELGESVLPTNHDRQSDIKMEESSNTGLRRGDLNQHSDEDQVTSIRVTLEQVQQDMGDADLLCRTKIPQQRPNPKKHLLALYGLSPLLRSVARNDPLTGEKINKLRKSYEGQIKGFGLAGINKPVKGDRDADEDLPGPLRRIAGSSIFGLMPEEQWQAENAKTRIEVTPDFRAKLRQAMQMQPGKVRDVDKWDAVLGHEKARPNLPIPQQVATPPVVNRAPNGIVRPQGGPTVEARRQTRGKKRSYGDDSFVGYGEGYSDPDDIAVSDGEFGDTDGGSRRKRKKDSISGSYGHVMGR